MTTAAPVDPSDSEWEGEDLDLDAIGLAAEFAQYVRGKGIAPGGQRATLGAWLDEMIDELKSDSDQPADRQPGPEHGSQYPF